MQTCYGSHYRDILFPLFSLNAACTHLLKTFENKEAVLLLLLVNTLRRVQMSRIKMHNKRIYIVYLERIRLVKHN
jgi:hypothetical protein